MPNLVVPFQASSSHTSCQQSPYSLASAMQFGWVGQPLAAELDTGWHKLIHVSLG